MVRAEWGQNLTIFSRYRCVGSIMLFFELHADPLAFEEKHGSQVDLIFRFLDHAFATGVLG